MTSSRPPVIFCFAGQGSQYFHMGQDLFDGHPVFRKWIQDGDEIVRAHQGLAVIDAVYDPARRISDPFDQLELTNPAVFLVQYALTQELLHHGVRPAACFGISLGEFTAMAFAGLTGFETTLASVAELPAHYRRICPPGGMLAVLGPETLYHTMPDLSACADLAGVNSAGHFILSAPEGGLARIERVLAQANVPTHRLPVHRAFHSRWIAPAEAAVRAAFIHGDGTPQWPVWSCCTGARMQTATPDLAWRIVRQPMQVRATIEAIETEGGATWVDCSPSGTIAAILRLALSKTSPSRIIHIMSPLGGERASLRRALDMLLP